MSPDRTRAARRALVAAVVVVVCAVFPAVSVYYAWEYVAAESGVTADFGRAYYPAAEDVLDGDRIFPGEEFETQSGYILEYVYPPLTAAVLVPFTALSPEGAGFLFSALLMLVPVATLAVLGVRDWRCYGLAYLFPPVLHTIQTGNVTIVLALAAALAWRFRDRPAAAGASLGIGLATKIILWPLGIWVLAARRLAVLAWAAAVACVAIIISWAAIRFDYLREYPDMLRRLSELQEANSYTVYALGLDLGFSEVAARALWASVAAALVVGVILQARRGDEQRAFIFAVAAVLACTPIVWIHYFTLLLVPIAVAQPTLGTAWFVGLPMQLVVTTGGYNGSTFQTTSVLLLVALAFALTLRSPAQPRRGTIAIARPVAELP